LLFVASRENHTNRDCFAVAVLSHGDDQGILYGTDTTIAVENLIQPIKMCRSLAGKPKIFIFQVDTVYVLSLQFVTCDCISWWLSANW